MRNRADFIYAAYKTRQGAEAALEEFYACGDVCEPEVSGIRRITRINAISGEKTFAYGVYLWAE